MKKGFIFLFAMVLTLLMIFTCCSSQENIDDLPEEEKAMAVMKKAVENIDSASSYATVTGITLQIYDQTKFIVDLDMVSISMGKGSDDYRCSETGEVAVTISDVTRKMKMKSGYFSGTMYMMQEDEGESNGYYSKISAEEYLEHQKAINSGAGANKNAKAESKTCKKSNDGEYTVKVSRFNNEAIDLLIEDFYFLYSYIPSEYYINDAELTFNTTSDLNPKSLEIKFEIYDSELNAEANNVELELQIEFNHINSIGEISPIDLTSYKEVDDLRAYNFISKASNDLRESKDIIEFETETITKVAYGTQQETQKNKYSGVVGVDEDGNYFFDYRYTDTLGKRHRFNYKLGQALNEADENITNDKVAREYFNKDSFLFPVTGFTLEKISEMESEEKEYKIVYEDPDISPYESIISSVGGTATDKRSSIIVTYDSEGRAIKVEYSMYIFIKCEHQNMILNIYNRANLIYPAPENHE